MKSYRIGLIFCNSLGLQSDKVAAGAIWREYPSEATELNYVERVLSV